MKKWVVECVLHGHVYKYEFNGTLEGEGNGRYHFRKDNGNFLRVPIERTIVVSYPLEEKKEEK